MDLWATTGTHHFLMMRGDKYPKPDPVTTSCDKLSYIDPLRLNTIDPLNLLYSITRLAIPVLYRKDNKGGQ